MSDPRQEKSRPKAAVMEKRDGDALNRDGRVKPRLIKCRQLIYDDASRARAGDVIEDGQGVRYQVLALNPNRSRGYHLTLKGKCAVCGEPFTVETKRIFRYLIRTCEQHRGKAVR